MSYDSDPIPKSSRRHHADQEGGTDSWLMSYADMITLLMCFFIIFVSVSEPKQDRFSEIAHGLVDRFGTVDTSAPLKGVFESMQKAVENRKLLRDVSIERTETGLSMEIAARALFEPASAEVEPGREAVLNDLAASLQAIDFVDYRILVEGHTSDEAVSGSLFASNWELSGARAARIVRYLVEQGVKSERMRVIAYADTRPKVPNRGVGDQPIIENREQNQRIVVRLERVF